MFKKNIDFKKIQKKYKHLSYKIFGKSFKNEEKYKSLKDQLVMADMDYTPGIFLSTITLNAILVGLISAPLYFFVFKNIINSPMWVLYTLGLTLTNVAAAVIYLPMLTKMKISTKKMQTDQEIPFTFSELSVLASTGLTPIKIVRHMAQNAGSKIMKQEFRKLVHKIDIEGKDIVTAIGEVAKETPSTTFRETLWDLANMIHQGGDLDTYLRQKADQTMQLRRDIQHEFIEKLGTYSEMYISLVLIGVLFIGIAAFLLDAMGSTAGGIDAETLLMLLAYMIIPVAVIVVNVIISSAYSRSG